MRPKVKFFILIGLIVLELLVLIIARVSYDKSFIDSLK